MISCGTVGIVCYPCPLSTLKSYPVAHWKTVLREFLVRCLGEASWSSARSTCAKPHMLHYNGVVKWGQCYIRICVISMCAVWRFHCIVSLCKSFLVLGIVTRILSRIEEYKPNCRSLGIISQRQARQIWRTLLDITLHWLVSFHLRLLTICFWCCCCCCYCWRVVMVI